MHSSMKYPLDLTDIRILSALQDHGELSKVQLSKVVNLSPTPCWTRLKRLTEAGYIRGYHAEIALDEVVDFTSAIVTISLSHHTQEHFDRFENRVRLTQSITECYATAGGTDYVMKVFTPSLRDFQELSHALLGGDLSIDRYVAHIVTREVKFGQPNIIDLKSDEMVNGR